MNDAPVFLFWGAAIDTNVTKALDSAVTQVNKAAENSRRFVTQLSHTVTVLAGNSWATRAAFDALSVMTSPSSRTEYFLVTVTATTVSQP